jgi:hypothetical protein
MATIPKNSKKIGQLKRELTRCRVYTLDNDFTGRDVEPRFAWEALATALHAKLTERDGTYTVHVHSNRWYELRRPEPETPGEGDDHPA